MKKNNKLTKQEEKDWEKLLNKLEDPNYEGETNWALPENATPLEKSKYELCQYILTYKQDNKPTTEKMAKKLKLSVPETKEIFLAHLDKFTLDRLMNYASQIFSPAEVKLTIEKKRPSIHV